MEADCATPTHTAYAVRSLDFARTGQFKPVFTDYLNGAPALVLLGPRPMLEELDHLASAKSYPAAQRATLVQVLRRQYAAAGLPNAADAQLSKLDEDDTCTVTTGHQLVMYLGPLYTALKALTVIRSAEEFETRYPGRKAVPIFWLAGEDHDLDEVSHVTVQGQAFHWQPPYAGPAGTQTTDGLKEALSAIWPKLPAYLDEYASAPTLAIAQRRLLHRLFGKMGLVVIDPDDAELKRCFAPIARRELTERFVQPAVDAATARLEAASHKPQIAVREVNLFLLGQHSRERLVPDANGGFSAGSLGTFTQTEILDLLDRHPERFSPNVAMRPLYQETLLPNLAYIGGPAEVAYWLQLKDVFEAAAVPMPAVWPRAHAMILTAKEAAKLDELSLKPEELLQDPIALRKQVVALNGTDKPDTAELQGLFNTFFSRLEELTLAQDKSLSQAMAAERARLEKQIEPGIKRLEKAYERRFEQLTSAAEKLQTRIAPNGGLQERTESYLTFELADPQFIPNLAGAIDPISHNFLIITLKDNQ